MKSDSPDQHSTEGRIPALRRDLQFRPGERNRRGTETWVLFDPVNDKYYRLDMRDYQIISHLKPMLTLSEVMTSLEHDGIEADKDEVSDIIRFLRRSHLFFPDPQKSDEILEREYQAIREQKISRMMGSYISFRIPLLKPDPFLEKTAWLVKLAFNRWTMWLLIVVACGGYISLFPNWTRFKSTFFLSLNFTGMLNYSLAIIGIKMIHELGHAYAAKLSNIRAREFGVAFIVFLPRLYTDLTDSWQIADRKKRMFIDAAGIIVELIIGGFAALIWTNTVSGSLHAICYFIFSVTMINTILFNGNPLMRFDGYYLLSDFLNIDNLYGKAIKQVKQTFRRLLWGIRTEVSWTTGNVFLVFYGFSAFFYRLFLYSSIIAVVYFKFVKLIGIVLALIEIQQLLIKPFLRESREVYRNMNKQKWAFVLRLVFFLAILASLFFVPLPYQLVIPCEVKAGKRSILYIHSEGYVRDLKYQDGDSIVQGRELIILDNPFLQMDLKEKSLERKILLEELDQISANSATQYQRKIKLQQLKSLDTVIDQLKTKEENLKIKSEIAGKAVQYHQNIEQGKWLDRGTAFGEVYTPDDQVVYGYLDEDNLQQVRKDEKVELFFDKGMTPVSASIASIQHVPLKKLESTPLQDRYGGVLKGRKKGTGWQSVHVLYQVLIKPDQPFDSYSIGRTGFATCKRSFSLGDLMVRRVGNFFQREKVF